MFEVVTFLPMWAVAHSLASLMVNNRSVRIVFPITQNLRYHYIMNLAKVLRQHLHRQYQNDKAIVERKFDEVVEHVLACADFRAVTQSRNRKVAKRGAKVEDVFPALQERNIYNRRYF
jgi:hypothetical protein